MGSLSNWIGLFSRATTRGDLPPKLAQKSYLLSYSLGSRMSIFLAFYRKNTGNLPWSILFVGIYLLVYCVYKTGSESIFHEIDRWPKSIDSDSWECILKYHIIDQKDGGERPQKYITFLILTLNLNGSTINSCLPKF